MQRPDCAQTAGSGSAGIEPAAAGAAPRSAAQTSCTGEAPRATGRGRRKGPAGRSQPSDGRQRYVRYRAPQRPPLRAGLRSPSAASRPHRGSEAAPAPLPPPARSPPPPRRVPPRPSGACALRRSPPSGSATGRRDGSHGETESRGLDPGGGERPAAHPAPVRAAGPGSAPLYAAGGMGPGGGGPSVRSERSVAWGSAAPARAARRSGSEGTSRPLPVWCFGSQGCGHASQPATPRPSSKIRVLLILAAFIASRFRCDRRSRSVTLSIWA